MARTKTDHIEEPAVLSLLNLEQERLRLEDQMNEVDKKIREAKTRPAGERGASADAQPRKSGAAASRPGAKRRSVADDEGMPEENRELRREVALRQRELNSLRAKWWSERGRQQVGGGAAAASQTDVIAPGQVEGAARLLMMTARLRSAELGDRDGQWSSASMGSSSSSSSSEVDGFGMQELRDLTPLNKRTTTTTTFAFDTMEESTMSPKRGSAGRKRSSAGRSVLARGLSQAALPGDAAPSSVDQVSDLAIGGAGVGVSRPSADMTNRGIAAMRSALNAVGTLRWMSRLQAARSSVT